jgi:hypothetical protein
MWWPGTEWENYATTTQLEVADWQITWSATTNDYNVKKCMQGGAGAWRRLFDSLPY